MPRVGKPLNDQLRARRMAALYEHVWSVISQFPSLLFLSVHMLSVVQALCDPHDRAEATTLSDPVDRLLYQAGQMQQGRMLTSGFVLNASKSLFSTQGRPSD